MYYYIGFVKLKYEHKWIAVFLQFGVKLQIPAYVMSTMATYYTILCCSIWQIIIVYNTAVYGNDVLYGDQQHHVVLEDRTEDSAIFFLQVQAIIFLKLFVRLKRL